MTDTIETLATELGDVWDDGTPESKDAATNWLLEIEQRARALPPSTEADALIQRITQKLDDLK
jgi:hypothetical protein